MKIKTLEEIRPKEIWSWTGSARKDIIQEIELRGNKAILTREYGNSNGTYFTYTEWNIYDNKNERQDYCWHKAEDAMLALILLSSKKKNYRLITDVYNNIK